MNKLVKFSLLVFVASLLLSCDRKSKIEIEGHIDNCTGRYIYFSEVRPDGLEFIDSARLDGGDFKISLSSSSDDVAARRSSPFFLQITLDNKNYGFTTLAKNGDLLNVCGDASSFPKSYSVNGSSEAENMRFLDEHLSLFIDSVVFLNTIYEDNIESDTIRAQVEAAYLQIVDNHTVFLKNYIESHRNSLSSIAAFYQRYNSRFFFDEKRELDILKNIYSSLSEIYKDNENVDFLKNRIAKVEEAK